jgi:hypothetical protein
MYRCWGFQGQFDTQRRLANILGWSGVVLFWEFAAQNETAVYSECRRLAETICYSRRIPDASASLR